MASICLRFTLVGALCFLSFVSYANDIPESEDDIWNITLNINGDVSYHSIPYVEINEKTIDVAGRPLHFVEVYKDREKGPKPLVVFIHGTPGGWSEQLGFLTNDFMRDNFHMIAVDRLGHGGSNGKIEPSLQVQAESLKPLLDRDTKGSGAILVGHSLGGPIIARTAMDYPEQVSGLVFIASTADPKRSHKWYNTLGGIPPVSWFLSRKLKRSNEEILPLRKQLKVMLPLWQTIKVPTTIIQGGKDKLVDPKNADFIQQALVNTEVNMIIEPEANHFIHWQQPQLVVDALAGFVAQGDNKASFEAASDDQALAAKIDDYMMSGVEKGYAGALLIAKSGEIILNKGFGLADKKNKFASTPDTIFDIGSNTKQFTAAAIMKLVDQNKLSTTSRLEHFFDKVPDDKKDITVHQLLTHTSGIDNGFGGDFDGTTKDEFLKKAFASELILKQGGYNYSNAGYSLLAAIIEKVSGMDYEAYLSQNILKPAGLDHTGYLLPNWKAQPLAQGYWHGVIPQSATVERYLKDGGVSWNLVGNGGLAATSNDLYKWLEALKTDKILSKSARDQIFNRHVMIRKQPDHHYGYGWGVQTGYEGKTRINHNGGNGTFYSGIAWYPEGDVTVIYSSNTSTAEWPTYQVHRMIFEPDYIPKAFTIPLHRVVYEYIVSKPAAGAAELPEYFKRETGEEIKKPLLLNQVGIAFEEEGQYDTAIALFKLNTKLFPDNGYLWASLGDGYLAKGDKVQAIDSYQKSLALAPDEGCSWCASSKEQLATLKGKEKGQS